MAGSGTSTARTVRPVACSAKKRRYASTSGSSGTAVVLPKGSPTSAEGSKDEAVADYIRVASLAEVPEGELRGFELATGRIAVAHVENELFALGDECTHEGCLLSEGEVDESADTVVCACHGSAFDLRTGEPVEGPAQDPVPTFPVRLVEGWIELMPIAAGGDA
jgi:3-phenylpropionate/trans-cinnamate dioxygenase ferredoxin subunit